MTLEHRLRLCLAALVFLLGTSCVTRPTSAPSNPDPRPPLTDANQQFRAIYAASRASLLARTRPIVIVDFGRLVLLRHAKPDLEEPHNPPLYHRYKGIAHIPTAIYVALAPWLDTPGVPEWRASLEILRDKLRPVLSELDSLGFPPEDLQRQREIVTASLTFIDDALARPALEPQRLRSFTRSMGALQLRNADAAAALQIDRIHAIVTRWRTEELSLDDWNRIYVVVLGFKMPRDGYAQFQYFERVLGSHESGQRLIYAEGLTTRDAALDLLGTIVTDRGAALYFFNDVMRMDRDVMADGAKKRLDQIFPPASK
jgi:hypothetical protein